MHNSYCSNFDGMTLCTLDAHWSVANQRAMPPKNLTSSSISSCVGVNPLSTVLSASVNHRLLP